MTDKCVLAKLAIVVPCYNEEEMLPETIFRLCTMISSMVTDGLIAADSFLLLVDDGSTDHTWDIITREASSRPDVKGIRFAHNSGQQMALWAGMEEASPMADMVITLDADLQDEISIIPGMVKRHSEGVEIIYAARDSRDADSFFKRKTARSYYSLMRRLGVDLVYDHAEFRLLGKMALEALLQYPERNLFIRGLVPKLGFTSEVMNFDRAPRTKGTTKYPLGKMFHLAVDGITSLSVRPVRLIFLLGVIFILIALGILIYVLVSYFAGEVIRGWSSLMISVWFAAGVILVGMGILGEYVGKIYTEVKQRPRYFISSRTYRSNT